MKNRYIPYGYRFEKGQPVIDQEEAKAIREIYGQYAQGQTFQGIAQSLIKARIPYSGDKPCWNKNNIKRIIENRKYIGEGGYPPILEPEVFRTVRSIHKSKTANWRKPSGDPSGILWDRLRCGVCGGRMLRNGSPASTKGICQLRCENRECGNTLDIPLARLHTVVFKRLGDQLRQKAEQNDVQEYQPSSEVIRLNNAINRAIENPDDPAKARRLILEGASARYGCCPNVKGGCISTEPDWDSFKRYVDHVEISENRNIDIWPSY